MGLLDDAIREHLELKRRHGASEEEIVRAEHEALAPARRDDSAGAGVPELEQVEGEPVGGAGVDIPPPPPPPPADEDVAAEAPPFDEPVYADEYAAEPAPADADSDSGFDPDEPAPRTPIPYDDDEDADYLAPDPVPGHGPAAHPPLES